MISKVYKPEIDGLRAFAVLSVVYFHAFPDKLPGGFVGVDIFFVISGYLISSLLFNDLNEKKFSIKDFYLRRIKRIFPALIIVLLSVGVFGWFFLLYEEYAQLGKHIFGGSSFISNYILFGESGYFDNVADTKPLLHLWSLSIEEQFYLFFPVLLAFLQKRNFSIRASVAFFILTSFFINVFFTHHDSILAFYSPFTRFWELLIGAALAANETANHKNEYIKQKNGNIAGFFGLFLILCSIFLLDKNSSFPGWWALMPVMGTSLLIWASKTSVINTHLFSSRPMVLIGLISYPIYLWHWPILSFLRISEAQIPSANLKYKAIFLSIILAFLTYRYVEKPIRYGKKISNKVKVGGLIFVMIIIGLIGGIIFLKEGKFLGNKEPILNLYEGSIGHADFNQYIFSNFFECTTENLKISSPVWNGKYRCRQSKSDTNVQLALVGNSHAEHLFIGLAENFSNTNIAFYIRNGLPTVSNPNYADLYNGIIKSENIKHVLINIDWVAVKNLEQLERELTETMKLLSLYGKQVFLTNGVPSFSFDPVRCKGIRFPHTKELCNTDKKELAYEKSLNAVVLNHPELKMLDTMSLFCNDKECSMISDGYILYRDDDHLNVNGSKYVGKALLNRYKEDLFKSN
jgi:peptidoglycan/LPS O-acetylase OafA/YrhL